MTTTMAPDFDKAISLIDAAHAEDPNQFSLSSQCSPSAGSIPYELHYARKMTFYLKLHTPNPSPLLSLAVRAQHLRRWEVPRSSYPDGKAGYLAWRAFLKKRQAERAREICLQSGFSPEDADRVGALVSKEGLRRGEGQGDEEVQILEDVACLVFLDDQFEEFEKGRRDDEDKIVGILRKTWGKMGERGHDLALQIQMSERTRLLIEKAVGAVTEERRTSASQG